MSDWNCELDGTQEWQREYSPERDVTTAKEYAEQAKGYKESAEDYAGQAASSAASVTSAASDAIEAIEAAEDDAVDAVEAAQATATAAVESAKTSATASIASATGTGISALDSSAEGYAAAIEAARASAVSSVGSAASTQVAAIQAEGAAQVAAVTAAGASELAAIEAAHVDVDDAVAEAQAASTEAQAAATTATNALTNAAATLESIRTDGAAYTASITAAGSEAYTAINGTASDAIATVEAAVASVEGSIDDYKTDAVAAVTAAGSTATEAASSAEASASAAAASEASMSTAIATHDADIESHQDIRSALTIEAETRADAVTTLNSGYATLLTSQKQTEKALKVAQRDIENLQDAARGTLYKDIEDERTLHSKTLGDAEVCGSDTTVLPNGELLSISGRTVVWNQLIDASTYDSDYSVDSGVVISFINVNSLHIKKAISSANSTYCRIAKELTTIKQGHRYYVKLEGFNSEVVFRIDNHTGAALAVLQASSIFTADDGSRGVYFYAVVTAGATCDTDIKFQIYDLTQMFGSTIADSMTVDAFEAYFDTSKYHPYNSGTLMSLPCKSVVTQGKNLFDKDEAKFINGYYLRDEWHMSQGYPVAIYKWNDFKDSSIYCGWKTILVNVSNYETITTRGVLAQPGVMSVLLDKNLNVVGENNSVYNNGTFNVSDAEWVGFGVMGGNEWATITNSFETWMVERGSTATAYSPFCRTSLVVPQAVKALTGYGWSAGSVCNEIDWQAKTYTQRVGAVDLGTLNWQYYSDTTRYVTRIDNMMPYSVGLGNIENARYTHISWSNLVSGVENNTIAAGYNTYITIRDTQYTSGLAFKSAMSGVMLYYELATPIVTDISDILPDNLLSQLETGGTVTFVADGVDPSETVVLTSDEQSLPVPNSIAYQTKIAS